MRVFSSREHTRALSASDVWAVVGWSRDLLPLAERVNDIVLVAPSSGTALWADMWAVPGQAQNGSKVITVLPLSGLLNITGPCGIKPWVKIKRCCLLPLQICPHALKRRNSFRTHRAKQCSAAILSCRGCAEHAMTGC